MRAIPVQFQHEGLKLSSVSKLKAGLLAQHTHSRGVTVGNHGIGRHHCGLNSAGETNARSGIDNMRVPAAIDFNKLLSIARGGECDMFEKHRARIEVAEFIYIA